MLYGGGGWLTWTQGTMNKILNRVDSLPQKRQILGVDQPTEKNWEFPMQCMQLQFSVTRILMKIFKTRSSDIIMECQNYFSLYTISTLIWKRKATLLYKLVNSQNELCELFSFTVQEEINIFLTLSLLLLCYVPFGSFCHVIVCLYAVPWRLFSILSCFCLYLYYFSRWIKLFKREKRHNKQCGISLKFFDHLLYMQQCKSVISVEPLPMKHFKAITLNC